MRGSVLQNIDLMTIDLNCSIPHHWMDGMRNIIKENRSIVLAGSFNPAIFHPSWFAKFKLIRDEEAAAAKVGIVHNDVTDFSTEWFRLLVTPNKFQLEKLQGGHEEELRDLALSTFEILCHTPVTALGINGETHFDVESLEVWHDIGHRLAPKNGIWDTILDKPGTQLLVVDGHRTDGYKGTIMVKVGPSAKVISGIFVSVNDHFDIGSTEPGIGSSDAVKTLTNVWDVALARFIKIRDKVMQL